MKSSFLHTLAVLLIGLFWVSQLQAQATLSVQGSILQGGTLAAIDNGQYDITFRLYTTDAGGTAIWTEVQSVPIVGGVYSVLLGDVTPLNVPFDQPYYLGLTIPGGPEHTPRAKLTAAPYALSLLGQDNKFPSTGNVGVGTTDPKTTLDANGSISTATVTTSAAAYTVLAADHVIFLDLAGAQSVTLPSAVTFPRREIVLINKTSTAKTVSSYVNLAGNAATAIPANGMIELRSNGTEWRLANSYVQPTVSTQKALVFCQGGPGGGVNSPNNAATTMTWLEVTDTGNNFDGTTFTAPRTGVYQVSGFLFGGYASFNSNFDAYNQVWLGGTCSICNTSAAIGLAIFPKASSPFNRLLILPFASSIYMTAGQTFFVRFYNESGNEQTPGYNNATYLTITEN